MAEVISFIDITGNRPHVASVKGELECRQDDGMVDIALFNSDSLARWRISVSIKDADWLAMLLAGDLADGKWRRGSLTIRIRRATKHIEVDLRSGGFTAVFLLSEAEADHFAVSLSNAVTALRHKVQTELEAA